MHELSIAESIVEIVKKSIAGDKTGSVESVKVKLGNLVGIEPESLRFCFEAASQGSTAQGANLKIEQVPALYRCQPCGSLFEGKGTFTVCSSCKNSRIELISGDELDVVEIELKE
jgi:hydrogenase nickel incorporation protein HypA/HybF